MATVTITFTDTDEEKGSVQISMESNPSFEDSKGTAAQSLGVRLLEILNQQLDKEEAEDCCHHEGCGCEHSANAVAPEHKPGEIESHLDDNGDEVRVRKGDPSLWENRPSH